jgi:hypothetical protein
MGINTGYSDVGNFDSRDRMEWSAGARRTLPRACRPWRNYGPIVLSYETHALVRDTVRAGALGAITAAPREPLLI